MRVAISSIADKGDPQKERIVMKVSSETDIGQYAMFRSHYNGESVTTAVTDVFWFPDRAVKPGDFIVLYTKPGNPTQRATEGGKTSHFFYWGRNEALWKSSDYSAVLLYINSWESKNPSQF